MSVLKGDYIHTPDVNDKKSMDRWIADVTKNLNAVYSGDTDDLWDDITGEILAPNASTAPGVSAFIGNIDAYGFDGAGAATEELFYKFHLKHDIEIGPTGSNIPTFHIHWGHNTATPSGNVVWQVDYAIARGYDNDTYTASPTTVTVTDAVGTQYQHHIVGDDTLTLAVGPGGTFENQWVPDAVVLARIYRNPAHASDTFTGDAYLFCFDIHYRKTRFGTRNRNAFTFEGFNT